ncbi:hypothetical protein [Granulicella mallensis]|uniref:Lipoprotein n=1 Tax=Granulicella mallensis TaxID=940614 RepID=A0A7W8ECJ8_9BACT|nr:hypothetical protein [Granulicella mallensis]MBB5066694.1 hypothetical protein [Granulicella mallensis]
MAASSFPFFYILAASCLSLMALPITRANAQTALPVLHLSSLQPLDKVQAASPGVKITQIYNGSPTITMWSAETPLTIAGGESECSFSLLVPHMSAEDVVLSTPPEANGVVTTLDIARFGNMSAAQALAAAYQLAAKLQAHGWVPNPYTKPSAAQAQRLLRRDFSVSIRDLRCGHSQIFISASSDPRHPKNVTWSFGYDLQPRPNPLSQPSTVH